MTSIRLIKKSKTIKIVSKDETIRLASPSKTIKVVNRRDNIRLKHTGKIGPEGEKGDIGTSTFVRVHHGSDPNVLRPDSLYVEWVGSVEPVNGTTEDTWIDTA